jgi:hypothetical protein
VRPQIFSFYLLLILRRRRFRQGREKSCLFLTGSNSSNIWNPSIHPSKSSSHGECSVKRSWAAAATNNGQDRQVHEGVEGVRLEEDGDIEHQVIKSWLSSLISVNRIWAAAETNNGQDRQVHEGVEGGHLVNDGDIHIQVIKSSSHGDKTLQRQRDRQVREGVEGDHLVVDGDIDIQIINSSSNGDNEQGRATATRPAGL